MKHFHHTYDMTTKKQIESLSKALGVLTLKSKLTFGKYKRKTFEFVLENDPDYIIWLAENTNQVIDKRVILEAGKKVLSKFESADAVEVDEEAEMGFSIEEIF